MQRLVLVRPDLPDPICPAIFSEDGKPNTVIAGGLKLFPVIPADSGLVEDSVQKFLSDISLMRIGNSYGDIALDHELMLAA